MTSSRDKGKRVELAAVDIYKRAGYDVERATGGGYQSPDFFDLYDLICAESDASGQRPTVRFVQVKSNGARGIEDWVSAAAVHAASDVQPEYAVKYDREGWRVLQPIEIDGEWRHVEVVDERESDGNMGDGVVDYLRGESP